MSRIGGFDNRSFVSRALVIGVAMITAGAVASGQQKREVFAAVAMSTGGPSEPVAGRLTFAIDRWTTADQAAKFAAAVKKGGSRDVAEALRDLKDVGRISSPGSIGYPIQYAVEEAQPDGYRHIILMTDRPMSFAEVWSQPATIDYPVTYIELNIDKDGRGSGKMMVASKLIPAGKLIVAEDWEAVPIQLNDVKKQS